MERPNSGRDAPKMSVARATLYARRMVENSADGEGDLPEAIKRVARKYGFTPSHVERARKGRLKTMDVSVFAKWRLAYLDFLESQVRKFQSELAIERASGEFDDVELFEDEAEALAQKILAAKGKAKGRANH